MIKEISANARISFKQPTVSGDVFYTFEYGEVRSIEDTAKLDTERKLLWEDVNNEIDKQVIEVQNLYNKKA